MPASDTGSFTGSDADDLEVAIAARLQYYLLNADTLDNNGLNTEPVYVESAGSGAPGDEGTTCTATVIFPDDDAPGTPYVRIIDAECTGQPDWGQNYNATQEVRSWEVVLDCCDNEFTGGVSAGADPETTGRNLVGAVMRLLRNRGAMYTKGFMDAIVSVGTHKQYGRAMSYPVMVRFMVLNDI